MLGLWLEHERAKARLAAFKAQLIAKGEKLAITDHVPKLPPALSNAAPDFMIAADRVTELKFEFQPLRMRLVAPGRALVAWQQPELATDKAADIWPELMAHVEENRPLLADMATALERPELVFNLDYAKGFTLLLPHLAQIKRASVCMANAALVDLHAGRPESALTNLLLGVRLLRLNEEPILISQLVRAATGHIIQQTTWELLQHPGWSDQQLQTLQRAWQEWDTSRGWLAVGNMERAFGLHVFAQSRGNPEMTRMLDAYSDFGLGARSGSVFDILLRTPKTSGGRFVQGSLNLVWTIWFSDDDERWTLEQHQVWMDGARRAVQGNDFESAYARMVASSTQWESPPPTLLVSRILLPAMPNAHKSFAQIETVRRLTFAAIALHRHRLKHGKFPASLGVLVPELLAEVPRDFMDGQPLRYQLQPDGQFLLWSVGENLKDDGGDPHPEPLTGSGSSYQYWLRRRDWVWPQAANEAEVAAHHAELAAKRAGLPVKPAP